MLSLIVISHVGLEKSQLNNNPMHGRPEKCFNGQDFFEGGAKFKLLELIITRVSKRKIKVLKVSIF